MRNTIVRALILSATVLTAAACEDEKKPAPAPAPSGSAAAMASDTAKPTPAPAPKKPMAEMQIATIDAVVAAGNAHDAKAYAAAYSPTTVIRMPPGPDTTGRDAVVAHMTKIFTAFPDVKLSKGRVWQKGNVAAVEWGATGTNTGEFMGEKASGRPMGFVAVSVHTFDDDGLIKESHSYFDGASIHSQLDPKAPAGSFRPADKTPLTAEVHASKGTPDEQKNLDTMKTLYKLIDDHKTADAMGTMTDDVSFVDYTQPGEMKGKKAISDWFGVLFKAFPDLKQPLGTQIAADDYVITEGVITATHKGALGPLKATNKPVNVHFVDVIQLKDGKLVKGSTYMNMAELLVQIGVMPMPGAAPAASGSAATPAGSAPAGTAKPPAPKTP